jgi:hypothetical protein
MKLKYSNGFLYCVLCLFALSCSAKDNDSKTIQDSITDTLVLNTHTLYIDSITEQEYNRLKDSKRIYHDSTPVRKEKNELILNLEGNKKLVLKDSLSKSDNVDQVTYTYVGFLKEVGFYIIIAQYNETGEYLLINCKTGSKTKVWGLPKLSPNQKRIVSSSNAIGYDVMPNGIQMWEVSQNGELKLEWEYQHTAWAPDDIAWANDSSIYVTKRIPDFLSSTKKEETSYIKISLK